TRTGSGAGSGSGPGYGQGDRGNTGASPAQLGGGTPPPPPPPAPTPPPPPSKGVPPQMSLNAEIKAPGSVLQSSAKLNPAVAAVIERLKNKDAKPGAEELKFTRDGKAEIQVWLVDKSAATIEQLKKLGFEVILDPQSSKVIIGRLPVEKL